MAITFLTEEEIWGDDALQVIKDYGTKTGVSDLTILLGGLLSRRGIQTIENDTSGCIWSASASDAEYVRTVEEDGDEGWRYAYGRRSAARPALPSSETSLIRPSAGKALRLNNGKTVQIKEYGHYPQTASKERLNDVLDQQLASRHLPATGKKYTFDSRALDDYKNGFKPRVCLEYEYQGKKYICVEAKPANDDSVLADGRKVVAGKSYWVEVEPIEWLADPKGKWVIKKGLFSGIRYNSDEDYDGNFKNTEIYKYTNEIFAKEMLQHLDEENNKQMQIKLEEKRDEYRQNLSTETQAETSTTNVEPRNEDAKVARFIWNVNRTDER